jgi:DNA-binding IclR family transcriptional regulator
LNWPKSSTYELIHTLLGKGILEFDNEDLKTFRLGIKVFELGMSVLEKTDLPKIARPYLEELSAKTDETVFLAVENSGSIVYLDRVEENSSITTSAGLGMRRPMYCTGLGKALLATYPLSKVGEIWDKSDHAVFTGNTIHSYDDLVEALVQTRRRGFAIDNREVEDEIFCVAAPIYGRSDKAVGAISIAVIYLKMNSAKVELFGQMITDTALAISKRLGYRRDRLYQGL